MVGKRQADSHQAVEVGHGWGDKFLRCDEKMRMVSQQNVGDEAREAPKCTGMQRIGVSEKLIDNAVP